MSTRTRRDVLIIVAVVLAAFAISAQLRGAGDASDHAIAATTKSNTTFFFNGRWDVSPEAAVFESGEASIDSIAATDPHVLEYQGTLYMYYTCAGTTGNQPDEPRTRICLATSMDGANWLRHPDSPVLEPGPVGTWDSYGLETPCVLVDDSGFKLYYMGYDTDDGDRWLGGEGITLGSIGLALSGDGVHFGRSGPDPVLTPSPGSGACRCGDWDSWALEGPWVIKRENAYSMYYGGLGSLDGSEEINAIGLATSGDGVHWSKYGKSPVFNGQEGDWDHFHTVDPCVIFEGGRYYLWYQGGDVQSEDSFGNFQIGMAISRDGKRWRRSSRNPVLTHGAESSWNGFGVMAPSVVSRSDGSAMLFFHGMDRYPDPTQWSIGRALPEENDPRRPGGRRSP